jgi:hypothetical protein
MRSPRAFDRDVLLSGISVINILSYSTYILKTKLGLRHKRPNLGIEPFGRSCAPEARKG